MVDTVQTEHHAVPRKLELSGITLAGRYLIERRIGRGGMGAVYRAIDTQTARPCAVKVLRPELITSREMFHRFQREIQVASSLGHPHIVEVSDSGKTEQGAPYFVMEFLEGRDLGDLLREQRPLPWRRVFALAVQICSALQAAHDAGVLHRDVKPENFFLLAGHDDFVKVLDFGIAKRTTREGSMITRVGAFVGTPEYMSPEQARGEDLDGRVDVYGLGILLYHLVVGHVPFHGRDELDVLNQHVNALPVPPTQANQDSRLPPEAEWVIMRALEKDPIDRYQSMAELGAAIQQVLDAHRDPPPPSLPQPSLPDSSLSQAGMSMSAVRARRDSQTSAVVAGLMLGVAILAAAVWYLYG